MDPKLCRQCNVMTLELLANYFEVEPARFQQLYEELLNDDRFLAEINERLRHARHYFRQAICRHESLDSVDWFAIQRIVMYVLIRYFQPDVCLETGVFYGGTTIFILNALRRNNRGALISIDLPGQSVEQSKRHHLVGDSETTPRELGQGFLVHPEQAKRWEYIEGDTLSVIPTIDRDIAFYSHDSEHSYDFIKKEMGLVLPKLTRDAIIMADDLNWSNGFYSFCDAHRLYPLIITDNGKSELLARTGVVRLDHPMRQFPDVVGGN